MTLLNYLTTPTGRHLCAALIFALLWLCKNYGPVKAWLAVDSRKVLANVVLALAPAAVALAEQSWAQAAQVALQVVLEAAGLQGVLAGVLGRGTGSRVGLVRDATVLYDEDLAP